MDFRKAFLAGVIGGLAMTVLMMLGRMMGMTEMNLEIALGSMMTQALNPMSWGIGLVMHLVISGFIACIYAFGFEYVTQRANWAIGAGFAVVHLIIAGLVMGMMGMMHPLMVSPPAPPPEGQLLAPGPFAANFGTMTTMAFIMLHLIYGAVVGALYEPIHRHVLKEARV